MCYGGRFTIASSVAGNAVLWGASYIPSFDLLALALLDSSVPLLPEDITANERECIYLSHQRCSWPEEWRTIKCWSFYCLGVGPWQAGISRSELYRPIIAELQRVVCALLPTELRSYEAVHQISLADTLDDPIHFSEMLHQALLEIFVHPLHEIYPLFETQESKVITGTVRQNGSSNRFLFSENISSFIAEVVEQVYEFPPEVPEELNISVEQLLEDLESLLWIIEGRPSHGDKLLKKMSQRYANAPAPNKAAEPSVWYRMRDAVLQLSRHQSKPLASQSQ